jgi:hypothetical protein
MATFYNVTNAVVGVTLDTNGVFNELACMTPPPPGRPPEHTPLGNGSRLLTLVDDSGPGVPRTLVNFDPFTQWLSRSTLLMSGTYNIPFGKLTVRSCPVGAVFRVNVA